MAKSKKSTGSSSKSTKPAAPAKPTPSAKPLIDASLVANAAARMVAARNPQSPAAPPPSTEPGHESAAFKHLKEGLAKTTPALGGSLAPVAGQSRSTLPHTFAKQVGRNQTFGADVNRSGVPRRTGG